MAEEITWSPDPAQDDLVGEIRGLLDRYEAAPEGSAERRFLGRQLDRLGQYREHATEIIEELAPFACFSVYRAPTGAGRPAWS